MTTKYQIINYDTGQALGVDGHGDSVTLQQRAPEDAAQLWNVLVNAEEDDLDIVNTKTGGYLSATGSNGQLMCGAERFGWDLPEFPEISPIATSDDRSVIGIYFNNRPQLMPNLTPDHERDNERWIFHQVL
ncbi:RICIN domain-containing protein [Nocardia niwae]|uniref:RICIN domain-containing protein n=1 Tax=Nocardia niwae TaxID=626084 RepID=UPI000A4D965D|nr:RICIN domain-containing protein [Nocardia niwae]